MYIRTLYSITAILSGLTVLPYCLFWYWVRNMWQTAKKVAPQKFMTWFTAVPLEEGENIVEMTYIPRGFVLGLCLMAVGALLLIAGVLLKDKVFNKEGRLC